MKKAPKKISKIPDSIPMEYHTIILEDIHDKFDFIVDRLNASDERQDRTEETINRIEGTIKRIDTRLTSVELDMMEVKKDILSLKGSVSNVEKTFVTKEDMKMFDKRTACLEKEVFG